MCLLFACLGYHHLILSRYAASKGFLGFKAYASLKLVSWLWKPDVRENERINKCLKLFWARTPNGSKELCSARAGLRHQLGPSQNECLIGKTIKWSTVRPVVQNLTARLLESWDDVGSVLRDSSRWTPAGRPEDHPTPDQVKKILPKLNPNLSKA